MCWSGEASAVLATLGLSSTAYFFYKKEPAGLCFALGYFSLMEALQAYTYTVIDQCGSPGNQVATLLGYIHIAFQPFFINAMTLHFIPKPVRDKIASTVYTLCFISTVCLLIRIYPFEWLRACFEAKSRIIFLGQYFDSFTVPFCGKRICSVSGAWHIAWEMPTTASFFLLNTYPFVAFIVPLFYGAWKVTLYSMLTGPFLAYLTTNNPNEWAAVWCLYSIGLLLILVKTPLRKMLYVNHWFWWKYLPA